MNVSQPANALRVSMGLLRALRVQSSSFDMMRPNEDLNCRSIGWKSTWSESLPPRGPNCWPLSMPLMRSSCSLTFSSSVLNARLSCWKLIYSFSTLFAYSSSVAARVTSMLRFLSSSRKYG